MGEKCKGMSVKQLREELRSRNAPTTGLLEKDDFVARLAELLESEKAFCRSGNIRPGKVALITGPDLEQELRDASTPLLLDVFAPWRGPCKTMAPDFEAAAMRLGTRCRVAKMDSDEEKATFGPMAL